MAERQEGFTLVELLVAIAIFAMVVMGVFYLWSGNQIAYLQGSEAAEIQQNARAAMEQMAREIRLAGYDPCRYVSQPPPAGNSCTPAPGQPNTSAFDPVRAGVFPIPSYSGTSIQVRMDRDLSGTIAGDLEDVTFSYNGATQVLQRNNQDLAQKITAFQLDYFNAAGAAPATALDIRLVRITLTAQQTFLGSPLTVNLQSDVRLRDR